VLEKREQEPFGEGRPITPQCFLVQFFGSPLEAVLLFGEAGFSFLGVLLQVDFFTGKGGGPLGAGWYFCNWQVFFLGFCFF